MKNLFKIVVPLLLFLPAISLNAAIYNLLNYGVPPHALGYADSKGFVFYSRLLGDLVLIEQERPQENFPDKIPIRIIFATNKAERKGVLIDAFWSISIYDSFVAKTDKDKYLWITPDLNTVIFRKNKSTGIWWADDGTVYLSEGKNNTIYIVNTDKRCSNVCLTYKDGLLDKIAVKRNKIVKNFKIYRNDAMLSIRDSKSNEVFRIDKCPTKGVVASSDFSRRRSKSFSVLLNTKDYHFYNDDKLQTIRLPFLITSCGEKHAFEYDFNKKNSKLLFGNKKFIEWDTASGKINKDWISDYNTTELNGGKGTIVSRTLPWGTYKYETLNKTGITRAYSENHSVEAYRICGIPRLFGVYRKYMIYDKSNNIVGRIQSIFNADGEEIRTIKERK